MKILEKSKTPDSIAIQLEYWDRYDHYTIGTYPIAQRELGFIHNGKTFRLSISENTTLNYTEENVKADYNALKTGRKQLADLRPYFWNGEKDAYILGLETEYKPE